MSTTAIYNDFAGLRKLQAEAGREAPEATREAARQFEALFVQMMLKSMRDAGAVLGEERDTTYEEMFDRQVALELTRNKGIGIAELLMRQLAPDGIAEDAAPSATPSPNERIETVAALVRPVTRDNWHPEGPDEFLRDVWPLAEQAGRKLGVDPRAVAAQAVLETGWGQKLIRDTQGVSSNNVFGIKADHRWDGDRIGVSTLEYDGGAPRRLRAEFRAYATLRHGFDDYVDFLQGNPRYSDATAGGLNAGEFVQSLQDAGYATDPRYAEKILGILESHRFERTLGGLKDAPDLPI